MFRFPIWNEIPGNLLVNVGPTRDGRISPIMEERLRQMGEWLSINGEAIYSTSPWTTQNDSYTKGVWFVYHYFLSIEYPKLNVDFSIGTHKKSLWCLL